MRIKEPFAQERTSEKKCYRTKYFIASEGQTTEPRYFEKLNQSAISENVTIINILRDYANLGNSNPTYLIKLLQDFLNNKELEISVAELKNKIANWNYENPGKINLNIINDELDKLYKSDNYKIPYDDLEKLFMHLFKSDIYKDLASNFSLYFVAQDVTYSPTTDSLNMIIDRDKDSFTEKQYDEVIKFCNKNNVNLYVSNPNFEFWLLLHFKEIEYEDNQKMLENSKVNSSKRYLEKRLHDICKYTKTKFSFKPFEQNIKDAIIREKKYEENIHKLKNNLGTNVGKLVAQIIGYEK